MPDPRYPIPDMKPIRHSSFVILLFALFATFADLRAATTNKEWADNTAATTLLPGDEVLVVRSNTPLRMSLSTLPGLLPLSGTSLAGLQQAATNGLNQTAFLYTAVPTWCGEDGDSDWDDLLGLGTQHSLMSAGRIRIIGVSTAVADTNAPYALMSVNLFYGRPYIPVARKTNSAVAGNVTGMASVLATNAFALMSSTYPAIEADYIAMRRALAAESNNTVSMRFGGPLGDLANLWNSPADGISSLAGWQLMTNKLLLDGRGIVVVVGRDSQGSTTNSAGSEYNAEIDPTSAQILNTISNIPITFVSYDAGVKMRTGQGVFSSVHSGLSPLRLGAVHVQRALGDAITTGRPPWSQLAALVGYESAGLGWSYITGRNHFVASGTNLWTNSVSGPHRYLVVPTASTNATERLIKGLEARAGVFGGAGVPEPLEGLTLVSSNGNTAAILRVDRAGNTDANNTAPNTLTLRTVVGVPFALAGPSGEGSLGVTANDRPWMSPFLDLKNSPTGAVQAVFGMNRGLSLEGYNTNSVVLNLQSSNRFQIVDVGGNPLLEVRAGMVELRTNLTLHATNAPPADTSAAAGWVNVTVGSATYKVKLHQ
jgi:hypothetical protein